MHKAIFSALLAVIVAGTGAILWYKHQRGRPEYALRQLAVAIKEKDLLAFEAHFDTKRVAQSVADQLLTAAVKETARRSTSESGWAALGNLLGAQMIQGMKPMLVGLIETSISAAVRGDPPPRPDRTTSRFVDKPTDLRRFREAFKGIEGVEQRENLALVRVRVQPEDRDSVATFTFRMERANGVWKIIGIENLADQLRVPASRSAYASRPRTYEERLEDAWVAAMRSDLRNLVTAEEAYFADSVKYTTDLGSLYMTTTGVTGPTIILTNDGYVAWVGSTRTTKTCALFVGRVRMAPAVKEAEPRCQEGTPTPPLAPTTKQVTAPAKGT